MADEHLCKFCAKRDSCPENKEIGKNGGVVLDCGLFIESDDLTDN